MKTNFLSLRFNFADLTEDLNALTLVRSRSTAIGTTDLQKLCKYCFLENMMNQMCTFNIGASCFAVGHVIFIIVTTVVHTKLLVTHTKHSKHTFFNIIDDIFVSRYCVSVRRSFCYNRFTISNKLVSA